MTLRSMTTMAAGLAILLTAGAAQAVLIQYEFSGQVNAVAEMGGLVEVGTPYTATWVFNMDTPDLNPLEYRGLYEAVSASLVVSGITVNKEGGTLDVSNETGHDEIYFNTPGPVIRFVASLADSTGMLLSSDALPLQIPEFPDRYVQVFWEPPLNKFSASIDAIAVSIVPEPSALSLAALGLMSTWQRYARLI